MGKINMSDVLELSIPERIQLVQDIWDTVSEVPDALELTGEQKEELQRRHQEHRENPGSAIPWEQVKAQIKL